METLINAFGKIAPYLTHPLVLVGFALLLVFGIHRTLIKSGIIPPLGQRGGNAVVQALLKYGFLLALAVILLGVAFEFLEKSNIWISFDYSKGNNLRVHHSDISALGQEETPALHQDGAPPNIGDNDTTNGDFSPIIKGTNGHVYYEPGSGQERGQ